jgi:hypothetical protein
MQGYVGWGQVQVVDKTDFISAYQHPVLGCLPVIVPVYVGLVG